MPQPKMAVTISSRTTPPPTLIQTPKITTKTKTMFKSWIYIPRTPSSLTGTISSPVHGSTWSGLRWPSQCPRNVPHFPASDNTQTTTSSPPIASRS
ncbi:hypothetical protein EMPG_14815 [Blastomyces silverae]|uniref:Uncharacterized protein n=1 Tax=Blastomyces silverae TaxID=2060906 RepID=A0A0H1BFH7_9EURO|nr:hypothetical protein EMPG_14815 [Blastomyces silverae]